MANVENSPDLYTGFLMVVEELAYRAIRKKLAKMKEESIGNQPDTDIMSDANAVDGRTK